MAHFKRKHTRRKVKSAARPRYMEPVPGHRCTCIYCVPLNLRHTLKRRIRMSGREERQVFGT